METPPKEDVQPETTAVDAGKRRRTFIIIGAIVAAILIAGGITAGVLVGKNNSSSSSSAPVIATTATTTAVAAAASTTAASAGSDYCTTSGGAYLSIVTPLFGAILVSGGPMMLSWNLKGQTDNALVQGVVTFEIADATDPLHVQSVAGGALIFKAPVHGGDYLVDTTVPASIPPGTHYTIKSSYKDGSVIRNCFSPQFTIVAA